MRKKKELPRKRRRFIKKVIYFFSFIMAILVVLLGVSSYFFILKLQKPLYISPLSTAKVAHADEGEVMEQQIEISLRKKQIDFTSVTRQNDAYVITLSDNGKVTFSTQKDIMTQIASLQYILSHLTMEGRQFSSLDLRFDQPVIMLKP
jgi:hypothetical protein